MPKETEQPEISRRGFIGGAVAMDLFGFDLDLPSMGPPDKLEFIVTEEVGAYVDITPEQPAALLIEPDGSLYVWNSQQQVWTAAGGSGGILVDSGTDNADGGDNYQLPQVEDAIDLQGGGDILNAASVETDVVNNADASAASQGEILQKAASGTDLTFASAGSNTPDWTKDGNSLGSVSGSSSYSITLASTYDEVQLRITNTDIATANSDVELQLQVNGDTGSNYFQRNADGTSSSASHWLLTKFTSGATKISAGASSVLDGRWVSGIGLENNHRNDQGVAAVAGNNVNVTSPLDSLTFKTSDGTSFSADIEVLGRDTP